MDLEEGTTAKRRDWWAKQPVEYADLSLIHGVPLQT